METLTRGGRIVQEVVLIFAQQTFHEIYLQLSDSLPGCGFLKSCSLVSPKTGTDLRTRPAPRSHGRNRRFVSNLSWDQSHEWKYNYRSCKKHVLYYIETCWFNTPVAHNLIRLIKEIQILTENSYNFFFLHLHEYIFFIFLNTLTPQESHSDCRQMNRNTFSVSQLSWNDASCSVYCISTICPVDGAVSLLYRFMGLP